MRIAAIATILLLATMAGCITDEDADVKIAFSYKLTDLISDKDPRRLANWVEDETGKSATIYSVDDSGAALEALRFGQADLAFLDGAAGWIGHVRFDLEAIAADQKQDGRTFYVASAWVRADSPIESVEDLRGVDSCHTGLLKSAGMFMPLAYLIQEGHIDTSAYPDDISAVEDVAHDFFGDPTIGGAYGGYQGALRCLSEGVGDVAFVRDTTPEDYCGDGGKEWCLDLSEYRMLQEFGPVPSHPVMVSGEVDAETRQALQDALLALNDSERGRSVLADVLETPGITVVDTEEHLQEFGELLSALPGMKDYQEGKYGAS